VEQIAFKKSGAKSTFKKSEQNPLLRKVEQIAFKKSGAKSTFEKSGANRF